MMWVERLRNGDVAINEVKDDACISVLVYNKDVKQCVLMTNFTAKKNPSLEDINYHFINSEIVLKHVREAGIVL